MTRWDWLRGREMNLFQHLGASVLLISHKGAIFQGAFLTNLIMSDNSRKHDSKVQETNYFVLPKQAVVSIFLHYSTSKVSGVSFLPQADW